MRLGGGAGLGFSCLSAFEQRLRLRLRLHLRLLRRRLGLLQASKLHGGLTCDYVAKRQQQGRHTRRGRGTAQSKKKSFAGDGIQRQLSCSLAACLKPKKKRERKKIARMPAVFAAPGAEALSAKGGLGEFKVQSAS